MSVSDFLLKQSQKFIKFSDPRNYHARIIEVDNSRTPKEEPCGYEPLQTQLDKLSQAPHHSESKGALHLLLHEWTADIPFNSCLPFKDEESLDLMIQRLQLPRCYPYDYGRWQHIPARMDVFEDSLEIVCHTPKFETASASLALHYEFRTRTTSCFLAVTKGEMAGMLGVLNDLKPLASHPLLLPMALYWVSSQILRRDVADVHIKMNKVQKDTGLLRQYLKVDNHGQSTAMEKDVRATRRGPTLTDIHQSIVVQHASLTRGLSEFTEELGQSCLTALDSIETLGAVDKDGHPLWKDLVDEDAHNELRKLLIHTQISTSYELHHRERMLSRVDIQQQVLYNLMQSRIGDDTLRDSSAMKSIAVLTMVFLPTTALATIFSMGSFFTQAPETGAIIASSKFWIFSSIAIPITAFVLICFFVWTEREWLWAVWRGEKKGDEEDQAGRADTNKQTMSKPARTNHLVVKGLEPGNDIYAEKV